jgi:hypothetical protein
MKAGIWELMMRGVDIAVEEKGGDSEVEILGDVNPVEGGTSGVDSIDDDDVAGFVKLVVNELDGKGCGNTGNAVLDDKVDKDMVVDEVGKRDAKKKPARGRQEY